MTDLATFMQVTTGEYQEERRPSLKMYFGL